MSESSEAVRAVAAALSAILAIACKRDRERVTITPDPARDASVAETADDTASPDVSPPAVRVPAVDAYNAVLPFVPSAPAGRRQRLHWANSCPRNCWPGDPICVHIFEYGSIVPGATPLDAGATSLIGRCEVDAHTGRVRCGDFGKPLRHVATVDAGDPALDAGGD